ncbi:MAG: phosphopentomutase [Candidatus Krumholzibacteria bacterium]|nr:phosphopentomutase [Candidatus Krumholzibacteria bacterium]
MLRLFSRIFCVVLDGVGVGEAPDAADYGDVGSNSLGNTARAVGGLCLPNLERMGLGNVCDIPGVPPTIVPIAHHGCMRPVAAGKDSTSGHWELMGCVLDEPMPVYPKGFPTDLIAEFSRATGRGVIGNKPASGTEIIRELGDRHVETGDLIVYTSQDSVFQIAAHEEIVPVEELYRCCEAARSMLSPPHSVGRVIARPFVGWSGAYYRTERRRDFSISPPSDTVLDRLVASGRDVVTIGKIDDLFAGRGITKAVHSKDNREGMQRTLEMARDQTGGLIFTNLVDFDTMWGHRNDARAYALGLEDFDSFLSEFMPALDENDMLIVTSDHGNDPTTPSTDHSREEVPLLVWFDGLARGSALGVRKTFADVGATVAENFGVDSEAGESFLDKI